MKRRIRYLSFLLVAQLALITPAHSAGPNALMQMDDAREALAQGNGRAAMDALFKAYMIIWKNTPLFLEESVVVSKGVTGYGQTNRRADTVFTPGEPILLYVAPKAFGFVFENEVLHSRFATDFALFSETGEFLAGKNDFGEFAFVSATPTTEIFLMLTLRIDGAPPGKYQIKVNIRDMVKDQNAVTGFPIEIRAE